MSDRLNKTRQMLVDNYIRSLEEDRIPWIQEWSGSFIPRNAVNDKNYNGTNRLLLNYIAHEKGYSDPRWCTFNQIADKNKKYHPDEKWHLKKGSKGIPIEYWYLRDKETGKSYTFEEYRELSKNDETLKERVALRGNTYTVFNAEQIEGIKPLVEIEGRKEVNRDEVLNTLVENMKVGFKEEGNSAFYSPSMDIVTVPPIEMFKDDYSYHATAFHELSHATGHPTRLNREQNGLFGSEEYAKEELRAEISSSFFMQELNIDFDEGHIQNHKAYIQSWISVLKNEPNELFRAISDANKISDYMMEKGGLKLEHEKIADHRLDDKTKEAPETSKKNIADRMKEAKLKASQQTKEKKMIAKDEQSR